MVKQLSLRLETLAPLAIRSDHAPDGAETVKYIPGTALVGGLVALHRLLHPDETEILERLFLREQIFYPNLYPAVFIDTKSEDCGEKCNLPVSPLPKTAQSCKRYAGFLFPKCEENDAHGVRDSVINQALFALSFHQNEKQYKIRLLAALREQQCCHCGEAINRFDGYYRRNDLLPDQMVAAQVESYTRLRTHTGIDRQTGTVQEGILYNRQVFAEGMQFWGLAKLPDDQELLSQLQNFLSEIGSAGLLYIGTGRSRGMGKVKLCATLMADEQDRFAAFKKRLDTLNDLIHGQAARYQLKGLQDRYFFSLTLHSPLILCDDLLRYRGTIDEIALEKMLHNCPPLLELQRVYQAASVRRVTGWQELWGTPRTNEYAIEMGSVFLFSCSSRPESAVFRALFALEENGAGKRRTEGFGRLSVSDQFHQEIEWR